MYRLMVENTIDVIIRYNAARARIYVSPSSREMFGYEPADMLGSHPAASFIPMTLPLWIRCSGRSGQPSPACN